MNSHKRIGILRGGEGNGYHHSLRKGGELISYISEHMSPNWKVSDILVDRQGVWHFNGIPVKPADLLSCVDVVWNTDYPDASLILKNLSIPYIGRDHLGGALLKSRTMLREHLAKTGVSIPRSLVIPLYQEDFDGPKERFAIEKAKEVHEKFGAPWIVKSFTKDESMGIHVAKTFPELAEAIEDGARHEKSILVEEFIPGKATAVHTVSRFREEAIYSFPLVSRIAGLHSVFL